MAGNLGVAENGKALEWLRIINSEACHDK